MALTKCIDCDLILEDPDEMVFFFGLGPLCLECAEAEGIEDVRQ